MSRAKDAILAVGRALDNVFGRATAPPRLSEAEALRIAQAAAEEQGWPWIDVEPVSVGFTPGGPRGGGEWHVTTNANQRGGNIIIVINDDTGTVLQRTLPRR